VASRWPAEISGANVHHKWLVAQTLDAVEEGKARWCAPVRSKANQQPAEAVAPGIDAFDDPAHGFPPYPAQQRLLAAAADMRRDPARSNGGRGILEVIALV